MIERNFYHCQNIPQILKPSILKLPPVDEKVIAFLEKTHTTPGYLANRLVIKELHNILESNPETKLSIETTQGQFEETLRKMLCEHVRKETIRIFHFIDNHPEYLVHVEVIDWLLGIQEIKENLSPLKQKHGNEQYEYQGTPYEFIRDFLHAVRIKPEDVLYDLGSGYGRVPLYAALTSKNGQYKGVEIVPERVQISQKAAQFFQLKNVSFINSHILDSDISDGTIFFLFNPFTWQTLEKVGKKFKQIASHKKIRIITWGGSSVAYLERQSWLKSRLIYSRELTRPMSWGLYSFESQK